MKNLKRTFAVILASLTLTVCCTACGNEQTPQTSSGNSSVSDNKDKTSSEANLPETTVSDFKYEDTSDGNGVNITKYKGKDSNVIIPKEINNKPVMEIGHRAFEGCTSITSVTIPDSVTSIGVYAFWDCESLENITIPDSVTSIDGYAFGGTAWFNNQPNGLVYAGKVLYKYKGREGMPENASIEIKDGTLGIAGDALALCKSLTSITIPNSVTSIGDMAFFNCTSLESVTIPDSVTSIGDKAFKGCKNLTEIKGKKGSAAEEYANKNNITFNAQ